MDTGKHFEKLMDIMHRLRGPGGCPWDREQTHKSIRACCIEEAYEVVEAIEAEDKDELCKELGDLLLQVVFHCELASEAGDFTIDDVVQAICTKLIRRHPHVFSSDQNAKELSPDQVLANWNRIKREEGRNRTLDGVPRSLPALQRALRISQKAAHVGFDWKNVKDVWLKVMEEINELQQARQAVQVEEEFGDLLFSLVNLGRHLHLDAEAALRRACVKFESRFRWLEDQLEGQAKSVDQLSAEALDDLWIQAKESLKQSSSKV